MIFSVKKLSYGAVICFAIALRSIVSLYSYSGAGTPPLYGDYEAQRHWQEICINLPPSKWYTNSSNNDLLYWGLDYPPLTAYHSLTLGKLANRLNSSYIELHASRGYESDDHKFFMRLSVLFADICLYIPAILLAVTTISSLQPRKAASSSTFKHLAVCLCYPGLILIDNGHFQYNNVSLGLATLAIVAILRDHLVLASMFFSLALNYKQMELYHAVPFFVYLLQNCIREKNPQQGLLKFIKIGTSVVVTFTLLWLPWLHSWDSFMTVVRRIFPINRGVFEDKVSNVWCVMNVLIKLKTVFSNENMALMCLIVTTLILLPSAIQLYRKPSKICFLYALLNSALTFFLFSFQVHEKSILLPALPAMLLYPFEPFMMTWFLQISTFSMFPLLQRDKLTLPFVATWLIFQTFVQIINEVEPPTKNEMLQKYQWLYHISCTISVILVLCNLYAPVPKRLPHVYALAISVYSCSHFIAFFCYTIHKQFHCKDADIK